MHFKFAMSDTSSSLFCTFGQTDEDGLSGTIPPEVGHLSKLENLILKNNPNLTGSLPTTLGHLLELGQLGLYNNGLTGTIPEDLTRATSLYFINMERNNLHGSVPFGIDNLRKLETLALMHNDLEGIVPFDQLSKTSIKYLGLSNNKFSSIIEHSLANVQTLESLYLDGNDLRERLPTEIGKLTKLRKYLCMIVFCFTKFSCSVSRSASRSHTYAAILSLRFPKFGSQ